MNVKKMKVLLWLIIAALVIVGLLVKAYYLGLLGHAFSN